MQRRGGKRIRMDEPPPEYENPMTPQVEPDGMVVIVMQICMVLKHILNTRNFVIRWNV
jgi:hypothetical protein